MRQFMKIVEEASIRSKVESLFKNFGGKQYAFSNLPQAGKNAVQVYWADEFGLEISPNSLWGYVEIPVEALKQAIGGMEDHPDFESYHQWYTTGGDIPDYSNADYAVILDNIYEEEVILDGWHRFHDYVRKGVKNIPAVLQISNDITEAE